MSQDFELMENLVRQAEEQVQRGRYESALQIYQQALGYLKKHMNRLTPSERENFLQVEVAIREEIRLVEDLMKSLKDLKSAWNNPRNLNSDDENNVYFDRQTDRTPQNRQQVVDKPWRPTPQAAARQQQDGHQYNNRQQEGRRETAQPNKQQQSRDDQAKPWKQNKVGKDGKPVKQEDELPSSYEGVDQIYVAQVHGMMVKKPDITFKDVAGLANAKKLLSEAIITPALLPEYFSGQRKPWRGLLLFGPPGTGKTYIAKAVAAEAGCCFFALSASSVMDKWLGSTEKAINAVFKIARYHAPSIVFIDEIDALMSKESGSEHDSSKRIRQEILTQMDGVGTSDDLDKHVVVLAATNHPYSLDEALRRRLEKRIYLPLPDSESRLALLQMKLKGELVEPGIDLEKFNEKLENYSASDINQIVKEASMAPLRRLLEKYGVEELRDNKDQHLNELVISEEDFEQSLARIRPSSNVADLQKYIQFEKEFASH